MKTEGVYGTNITAVLTFVRAVFFCLKTKRISIFKHAKTPPVTEADFCQKLEYYCVYQERCHKEVEKLRSQRRSRNA